MVKNGTESDVDCGGAACVKCAIDKACLVNSDCGTNVCIANLCKAPTCTDAVKDGSETDVDCGGACPTGCSTGKACLINADCASMTCTAKLCL